MDRVEALSEMITGAMNIADWIAQDIVSIPLEPKKDNLHLASLCLSHYKDISHIIYKDRPELKPYYLRDDIKRDPDSETYGPDNPLPEEAIRYLEIANAIEMLKVFSASGKNKILKDIAELEIPKLEARLNQPKQ